MKRLEKLSRATCAAAAAIVLAVSGKPAQAEAFPEREVRIIVGYNPGSTTDLIARTIAQELSDRWGQPVIVDNRPGASGLSGAEALVHSEADGYTYLFDGPPPFLTNGLLRNRLPYDPADIQPVVAVTRAYVHYTVAGNVPADTMEEFESLVRTNPGLYTYGASNGSSQNLNIEGWKKRVGLDLIFVPYTGSGAAITDMLGGRLSLAGLGANAVVEHTKSGALKVLGVSTPERLESLPDVPTLDEQGFSELNIVSFLGIGTVAGSPAENIAEFARAITEIVNDPEFQQASMVPYGFYPAGGTPEEFVEFLATEHDRYAELVRLSGISLD